VSGLQGRESNEEQSSDEELVDEDPWEVDTQDEESCGVYWKDPGSKLSGEDDGASLNESLGSDSPSELVSAGEFSAFEHVSAEDEGGPFEEVVVKKDNLEEYIYVDEVDLHEIWSSEWKNDFLKVFSPKDQVSTAENESALAEFSAEKDDFEGYFYADKDDLHEIWSSEWKNDLFKLCSGREACHAMRRVAGDRRTEK
jgi:hypothetical protein